MKEVDKLRHLSEWYRQFAKSGSTAQHDWRMNFAEELNATADKRERRSNDAQVRESVAV
jgi:hypothetical protein